MASTYLTNYWNQDIILKMVSLYRIDELLGGNGFSVNHVTEILGQSSAGKTQVRG